MRTKLIIEALEDKYKDYGGSEEIQADTIFWLWQHLSPQDVEEDIDGEIENLKSWLKDHDRCLKCGGKLFATYRKDMTVNPPMRKLFKFCLKCEG